MRARQGTSVGAAMAPLVPPLVLLIVLLGAAPVLAAGFALAPSQSQSESRPSGASPVVRMVPESAALTAGPMAPGDVHFRPLEVHNDGPGPVRYRILALTADREGTPAGMGAAVRAEVRRLPRGTRDGCTPEAFDRGVPVAGPASLSALEGALGPALAPGQAHHLCVRLVLDPDAPNALQGAVTDAELRLVAESP